MPASFLGWLQSWPDFDNCKINSTRKPFKNNLLLLLLFNLRWIKMYVSQVPYTVASTAKYPDTIPVPQWNCNLILKFCSVMHLLYCLSFLSWIKLSKCFSFSCFRRIFQHIQIEISSLADCYNTWTLYVLQIGNNFVSDGHVCNTFCPVLLKLVNVWLKKL